MRIQFRINKPVFTKKCQKEYASGVNQSANLNYLLWTLNPSFHFVQGAVFLTGENAKSSKPYKDHIDEYGKFNAQGLVNHIHLNDITSNQKWQYEIGLRALLHWSEVLKETAPSKSMVFYLNECHVIPRQTNYVICVYGEPKQAEISELESTWKDIEVLNYKKFHSWARNITN